jgi:hypothetical protein
MITLSNKPHKLKGRTEMTKVDFKTATICYDNYDEFGNSFCLWDKNDDRYRLSLKQYTEIAAYLQEQMRKFKFKTI